MVKQSFHLLTGISLEEWVIKMPKYFWHPHQRSLPQRLWVRLQIHLNYQYYEKNNHSQLPC